MNLKRVRPYILLLLATTFVAPAFYVALNEPRFTCDRCRTSLVLLKGGFRSWGVTYCYGFQPQPGGGEKHFYHFPKFYRNDIRGLLQKEQQ